VSTGGLFLAAWFDPNASVDFTQVAPRVIVQVGYDQTRFNSKSCTILTSLEEMPKPLREQPDIDQLSESDLDQIPAMDQATVFGVACNQTPEMMPLPVVLAHQLARKLHSAGQEALPHLNPDGKTQVGVEEKSRQPKRIHSLTLVASQKESANISLEQLRQDLQEQVFFPAFAEQALKPDNQTRIFINPEGPFISGGRLPMPD
jgi:S-adenosylmethionine synthetase